MLALSDRAIFIMLSEEVLCASALRRLRQLTLQLPRYWRAYGVRGSTANSKLDLPLYYRRTAGR